MRVCAIDIGSNSVRCLIVDVARGGRISPVERGLEITRLGGGMGRSLLISPDAAERTAAAVERYVGLGRRARAERFLLFGTAILREAENAQSFIDRVKERTGQGVRILSGIEEAAFAYRGVTRTIPPLPKNALVIDIGGGSVEFIIPSAKGEPVFRSAALGCVRMTERFFHADPPGADELASLREYVARTLDREMPKGDAPPARLFGAGGTITAAAALTLGLTRYEPEKIHGCVVSLGQIAGLIAKLSVMPLAARKKVQGLEENRADIIIAGLIVLQGIMEFYGFKEITVSDEGILHGAVMEYAYTKGNNFFHHGDTEAAES
jgi:exopolyphosphatase / guanosine-5'-triphosphate,3'-diphosphate pyrophosphatase